MKQPTPIPTKALLRFIVTERDRLQKKLDELVPYTKNLEQQIQKTRDLEIERLKKENASLQKQLDNAINEAKILRSQHRQSDWYRTLQKNYDKAKKEVKELREHIKQIAIDCKKCRDSKS